MALYAPAYEKMIINEGGYRLHKVDGDRGGLTYAGITEKYYPDWEGWNLLKNNPQSPELAGMVKDFYEVNFWQRIKGVDIASQDVAESIFDFAVNAGVATSSKLAQIVVEASPDGVIGSKTLEKINAMDSDLFVSSFSLAKVARYAEICNRDKSQSKFLLGWINRTLKALK